STEALRRVDESRPRARRVDEPRARRSPGRPGAVGASRLFARLLSVLRLWTGAREARRSGREMRAARRRHRDASRRRPSRHGVVRRRGGGSRRRAPRVAGDSDSGVFEPYWRSSRSRRVGGTRRADEHVIVLAYVPIYIAAVLEGEIYYSKV